jgi:hypothetical protein
MTYPHTIILYGCDKAGNKIVMEFKDAEDMHYDLDDLVGVGYRKYLSKYFGEMTLLGRSFPCILDDFDIHNPYDLFEIKKKKWTMFSQKQNVIDAGTLESDDSAVRQHFTGPRLRASSYTNR